MLVSCPQYTLIWVAGTALLGFLSDLVACRACLVSGCMSLQFAVFVSSVFGTCNGLCLFLVVCGCVSLVWCAFRAEILLLASRRSPASCWHLLDSLLQSCLHFLLARCCVCENLQARLREVFQFLPASRFGPCWLPACGPSRGLLPKFVPCHSSLMSPAHARSGFSHDS